MDESSGREIRRLRSIFWSERDPEGRAFPTLADAYRRAGDLDQALELLTDGLDRHPAFATGHVVAAWVHRDRSDLEAAEAAFRRVLELDEENVQALHGLGKILVVRGQVEEAQALLTRAAELGAATEADLARGAAAPEEPDVGAELPTDTGAPPPAAVDAALEALPHTGTEPSSVAPGALEVGAGAPRSTGEAADEAAGAEVVEVADLAPDGVEEEAGPPAGPWEPAVVEIADLAPDRVEAEAETPAGPAETPVVDIADLAPDPVEIADLAPDEEAVEAAAQEEAVQEEALQEEAVQDEPVRAEELQEEPVQGEPVQEEAVQEEAVQEEAVQDEPVQEELVQAEAASEPPAAERARDEGAEEAPVAAVGAEAFRAAAAEPYDGPRTRTMAELYARQGLLDRAVDIYEHLVRERPQERDLRNRMEELRARRRGDEPGVEEEVEAMAREMSVGDHAEAMPSPFTWADDGPSTGGAETETEAEETEAEEPIAEWFGELLAWGPGARPPEDEPPPHGDTLPVSGEDR